MRGSSLIHDVQRLREALGHLPEPVARPSLVMVSGLPGTGKSHFCRRLAERVPMTILESDHLRKLLFARPSYSARENSDLFEACYKLIEELLRSGITVALDATNLEEHHRERVYHVVDQTGAGLVILRIEAPAEVVYERLQGRGRAADPEDRSEADSTVYDRMKPTADRIRRNHLVVDTSKDITIALDKVARKIGP